MGQKLVSFERKGYRDVYWCPTLNEPVILTYNKTDDGEYYPYCCICKEPLPSLEDDAREFSHAFIAHILKPQLLT